MTYEIYRVAVDWLNLRDQPNSETSLSIVTQLRRGQAVARLNAVDYNGWYFVFADTPGDSLYVGYVSADPRYLEPLTGLPDARPAPPPEPYQEPAPVHDDDPDDPVRDLDEDAGQRPPMAEAPEPVPFPDGWDPRIPEERRHRTEKRSRRRGPKVEHVVIHVTGTTSLSEVVNRFMTQPASAHYLVTDTGEIHQFVSENDAAWHAGVKSYVKHLYNSGDWRRYKRYFAGSWAEPHYPPGSVYVSQDYKDLPSPSGAALVRRSDGSNWPAYAYFDQRWGAAPLTYPVGYSPSDRVGINHKSIGIELLSIGSPNPGGTHYTEAMYDALVPLVDEICARHGLPKTERTICGHEDVNPVERWGWDPAAGLDWARVRGPVPPRTS